MARRLAGSARQGSRAAGPAARKDLLASPQAGPACRLDPARPLARRPKQAEASSPEETGLAQRESALPRSGPRWRRVLAVPPVPAGECGQPGPAAAVARARPSTVATSCCTNRVKPSPGVACRVPVRVNPYLASACPSPGRCRRAPGSPAAPATAPPPPIAALNNEDKRRVGRGGAGRCPVDQTVRSGAAESRGEGLGRGRANRTPPAPSNPSVPPPRCRITLHYVAL